MPEKYIEKVTEPIKAGVTGVVRTVEPPKRGPGGNYLPTKFTIFATMSKITVKCVCSLFCWITPEDNIRAHGYMTKKVLVDVETNEEVEVLEYKLDVKVTPIIEPSNTKQSIIEVFNHALPRRGRLAKTIGPKIYSNLAALLKNSQDPNYKELDMPNRINFYMVEISNLSAELGKDLGDSILEPFTVDGLLDKTDAIKLIQYWYKHREKRKLQMLGLSSEEIKESGLSTQVLFEMIKTNPYAVPVISLKKCEMLLSRFGKYPEPEQIRRGEILRHVYDKTHSHGWSCVPIMMLRQTFPDLNTHLDALISPNEDGYGLRLETFGSKVYVYLQQVLEVEQGLANRIIDMVNENKVGEDGFDPVFRMKTLSDEQKAAIYGAMNSTLSAITGGGGCGKTTSIIEIAHNFDLHNVNYAIASLTGIAVSLVRKQLAKAGFSQSRINKMTYTLHRGVGNPSGNDDDDLTHLIVDEASMVTADILYRFLKRNPKIQSIIMVGDCNQLLPIGYGCFFSEVIASNNFPIFKLNTNYRVANQGGGIKANGEAMRAGTGPFRFTPAHDYIVYDGGVEAVLSEARKAVDAGVHDYQFTVVTPYNKIRNVINSALQNMFRFTSEEENRRQHLDAQGGRTMIRSCLDSFKRRWCLGDRVIMLENNYDIGVFNGEEGRVIRIDPIGKKLQISFSHRSLSEWIERPEGCDVNTPQFNFLKERSSWFDLVIPRDDINGGDRFEKRRDETRLHLGMVDHAYALTVHKSQGSEWDISIFYVPDYAKPTKGFFNKNLVYTGTTRAKLHQVIIGNTEAIERAANTKPAWRCENTKARFNKALPSLATQEEWDDADFDDDYDVFEDDDWCEADA